MKLNEQQYEAVTNSYDKDVVLSAIPGSGKTRTLIERIKYILKNNLAKPEQILSITFTKKAANEMIERLNKDNIDTSNMAIGTFHSVLQKILRKYGSLLGIANDFEIIDYHTQYKIITDIMKKYNMTYDKEFIKDVLSTISSWKNNLISSKNAIDNATGEEEQVYAKLYYNYMVNCTNKSYIDFDDILMYSYVLLITNPKVKDILSEKYKYILVDEYQDSNLCQIKILQCLKTPNNNLMAIGDPDQSIYGFRDARPSCMTEFNKYFPNSKVLKLEKNYRSTKTIVDASHCLIRNNKNRIDSIPKTDNEVGSKIKYFIFDNETSEANYIANLISFKIKSGEKEYSDFAIIYRNHYMSNSLEKELKKYNVPFLISGSVGFYDRKEIKDLICFLKLKYSPRNSEHFTRCMGQIPGLGKMTIEKMIKAADNAGIDYISAMQYFYNLKSGQHIKEIYDVLSANRTIDDILIRIITILNLDTVYRKKDESTINKWENILELIATAKNNKFMPLEEFLDSIVLDKANITNTNQCVKLMTMHSAKGLEFDTVFLIGLEETTLPSSFAHGNEAIEEERRLCYVGMTRAKKMLYMTRVRNRRDRDKNESRFISEIPIKYMDIKNI